MRARISGSTKLAGVIGWPLEHTLSPAMHNAAYEAMGLDWVYLPLPVQRDADLMMVASAVRALPFVGLNVTMPYKRIMLDLCDEVATAARLAGAVNTVHCDDGRLVGYNTDGRGLLDALREEAGFEGEGKAVTILGAGGAAGAAVVSLIVSRAARVTVLNRDPQRAERIIERVEDHMRATRVEALALDRSDAACEAVSSADLVINATPVGMDPADESPIPGEWLRTGQIVADMVYAGQRTALLQAAEATGATALGGLGMLVAQGALAIEAWNQDAQVQVPRDVMRSAAEDALREAQARSRPRAEQ